MERQVQYPDGYFGLLAPELAVLPKAPEQALEAVLQLTVEVLAALAAVNAAGVLDGSEFSDRR